MPSSSKPIKSKPEQPKYRISPETFKVLHPVHYQIFDILKQKIPVTIIQACRDLYKELVPKIYERIEIHEDTYDGLTDGVYIEENPDLEEDDEDQGEDNHSIRSKPLPLPGWKNNALTHTKFLSFKDINGATKFIADCGYCDSCEECNYKYTIDDALFLKVEYLHLGKDIVLQLAETHAHGDIYPPKDSPHRIHELFEYLWRHVQPNTICLDWPEDWDFEFWFEDMDDEDSDSDPEEVLWSIKSGMNGLLTEISQQKSIKLIILHINTSDFLKMRLDLEDFTHQADFVFNLDNDLAWTTSSVLKTMWQHFRSVSDPQNIPFTYSLPPLKGFKKTLGELEDKIKSDEVKKFTYFKERLEVPGPRCEHCEGDSV